MSDLPQIDPNKVADVMQNKLASQNLDLLRQLVSLELLATALRDERDSARAELARRDAAE